MPSRAHIGAWPAPIAGAAVDTPGFASDEEKRVATASGRLHMMEPDQMRAPVVWLVAEAAKGLNGMRYDAVAWDASRPGAEQAARTTVPQRKSEHAVQLFDAFRAFFTIEVQNDLRVRVCRKMISGRQVIFEFCEIVNFAVAYNAGCAAICQNGLVAVGHIHYGQPGVAENSVFEYMKAPVIRAAMR